MTPIEYLTHCRVEAASRLLLDQPEMNITDVAFSCGFNSSQYFATVFQAHQGCSPSEFRNLHSFVV
jgi:AraC family L-rhamnose operon regulatory protein RhaS